MATRETSAPQTLAELQAAAKLHNCVVVDNEEHTTLFWERAIDSCRGGTSLDEKKIKCRDAYCSEYCASYLVNIAQAMLSAGEGE